MNSSLIPDPNPIKTYARDSRAKSRLPKNARCACGEDRPEALIRDSNPLTCFRCKQRMDGKSGRELHHVAGNANHPGTIQTDGNDHRVLSAAQSSWESKILRNPHGSPLIAAAACILGSVQFVVHVTQTFLLWIVEMLVKLDDYLLERLGASWWLNTPIAPYRGRRSPK